MKDYFLYQKILNETENNFSIEDTKLICDLLEEFAILNIEIFFDQATLQNEKSNNNVKGEL